MRIFSKDSSTPGALFRKAGRPPDRLSSSSFDTPSTWLSNLGSQHHKGYQGENSQHVGSSHDIARPLPDSQVTGKGFRRDADMPGKRGKEEQERHLRLMGKDGKAARAKDAEEVYGDRCRQNSPCRPLQHEVALLAGTRWALDVGQHQSGSADACEHVRSRRAEHGPYEPWHTVDQAFNKKRCRSKRRMSQEEDGDCRGDKCIEQAQLFRRGARASHRRVISSTEPPSPPHPITAPCTLRAPDILDPTTPACCDHSDVRMPWRPLSSIWPIISAAVPFAYSREGADASLCGHLNMRPHCFAAARIRGCCSTRNDTSPLARSQSLFGGTHRTAPRPTSAAYPAPARISCSEKVRTCGSRWYASWSPP